MAVTEWLIDKSALVRLPRYPARGIWNTRIERGLIRITPVTRLEVGFSAKNGAALRDDNANAPMSLMPLEFLTPAAELRAMEVQILLADKGHHRAPSPADLLLAAIAETQGLTLLAHDKDFGLISEITGQPIDTLDIALNN